jgi:hypothetical protein
MGGTSVDEDEQRCKPDDCGYGSAAAHEHGSGRRCAQTTSSIIPTLETTTYTCDQVNRETVWQYQDGSLVTQVCDAVGNRTLQHDATGRYTSV